MEWQRDQSGTWLLTQTSSWDRSYTGEKKILGIQLTSMQARGIKEDEPNKLACLIKRLGRLKGWIRPELTPISITYFKDEGEYLIWVFHPSIKASKYKRFTEIPNIKNEGGDTQLMLWS